MPSPLLIVFYVLLWLLVLAETLALCSLARKMFGLGSSLLAQVASDGLPIGMLAPVVTGTDTHEHPFRLGGERDRYQVILFLSAGCSSCRLAMQWLPALLTDEKLDARVVVTGTPTAVKAFADEYLFVHPLVPDPKDRIGGRYGVLSSPFAMVLNESGRIIGKGFVSNYAQVRDLIRVSDMRAAMGGVPVREEVQVDAV